MTTTAGQRRFISVLVLLFLAGGWQFLSIQYPYEAAPGVPLVPGWQIVFTRTLLSLSYYWPGGFGFGSLASGEEPNYTYALLALVYHTAITIVRVVCGLVVGCVVGTGLALIISSSRIARDLINWPAQFLRALPLLVMVPLFQLWFGVSFMGEVTFVAYGVGVIFFASVLNALANVPQVYIDNARMMGADQATLYRSVMIPGILLEFQSAMMLTLGVAWSAVVGAEFLTAQSGLGFIIVSSRRFGYLDRMFLAALVIVFIVVVTSYIANRIMAYLTRWTLKSRRST